MFTIRIERTEADGTVRHAMHSARSVSGDATADGDTVTLRLHDDPGTVPQVVQLAGLAVAYVMNEKANTVWTIKTSALAHQQTERRQSGGGGGGWYGQRGARR